MVINSGTVFVSPLDSCSFENACNISQYNNNQCYVALHYQTIAHGVIQDLYRDNQLEQVQAFKSLYDAQSLKYETITSAQTSLVHDGRGTPPSVPTVSISTLPTMIVQ